MEGKRLKTSDNTRQPRADNLSKHVDEHINSTEDKIVNSSHNSNSEALASNLIRRAKESYSGRASDKQIKKEILSQIDQRIAALNRTEGDLASETMSAWKEVRPHVQDAVDATRNQGWS